MLIGFLTLIFSIILCVIYLKVNFFIPSKKIETALPKQSNINKNDQNLMETFENTIDIDEDELT